MNPLRRDQDAATSNRLGSYVHIGCGFNAPQGWINFDASPTLRFQRLPGLGRLAGRLSGNGRDFPLNVRFGDVTRRLPIAPGSATAVYASHVLEHLALDDFRKALASIHAMLRPGGTLRLVVPDLRARALAYAARAADPEAAHHFMRSTGLGVERRPRSLLGRLRHCFGHSAHLWMWDEPSLAAELARAGFGEIRRVGFGEWRDPMFALVEQRDGLVSRDGAAELAMEAVKL